jgi:hypothetical protein
MAWRRGSVHSHLRSTESQLPVGLSLNFDMSDRAGSRASLSRRDSCGHGLKEAQSEADQIGVKKVPSTWPF